MRRTSSIARYPRLTGTRWRLLVAMACSAWLGCVTAAESSAVATTANADSAPASAAPGTRDPSDAMPSDPAQAGADHAGGTPDPGEPADNGDNDSALRRELLDLAALLEDRLPDDMPLAALFEVDLSDESAVQARVALLTERLGGHADATATDATTTDAATTDAATPAGLAPLDGLRRERDQLRLEFLARPASRRAALLEQERLRIDRERLQFEQQATTTALVASEQARERAVNEARQASTEAQRAIATEQARLLAVQSELNATAQMWNMRNQGRLAQREALLQKYAPIDARHDLTLAEADALYTDLREDLRGLRADAARALAQLHADGTLDGTGPGDLASDPATIASQPDAFAALRALHQQTLALHRELIGQEAAERRQEAALLMDTMRVMQERRLRLVQLISPGLRDDATGFTRHGLARLRDEVRHAGLMLQWYPQDRLSRLGALTVDLDGWAQGRIVLTVLCGLLVVAALAQLHRHRARTLALVRTWTAQTDSSHAIQRRVERTVVTLNALSAYLLTLAGVAIVFDVLIEPDASQPELQVARQLAYAVAWYWLALALAHRVLMGTVSRYHIVSVVLNRKIRHSLRRVARLALLITIWVIVAEALLGRGALYAIAVVIAWIGGAMTSWLLIRDWRSEVAERYLQMYPEGRLAQLVQSSRDRNHGLLVVFAAFAFVAGRGLWFWLRDVFLQFENTRKALAYLFRLQLERNARRQAYDEPTQLPDALEWALTEEPASSPIWIDHFPGQAELVERARRLAAGGRGGVVALVGERGAGKTTWLRALESAIADAVPVLFHAQEHRTTAPADVVAHLGAMIGQPGARTAGEAVRHLQGRAPGVVMVDLAHNYMLRCVGGNAAYETLIGIAQASSARQLWIIAFARWPFEYLRRLHANVDIFDHAIVLKPWSETQISELIETRMERSGHSVNYEQLALGALPELPRHVDSGYELRSAGAERNADRYHRLIWDYADGNPRVALHFWRLSLRMVAERAVSVQLFPMPQGNALERYAEQTRFLLACLVQHENLTAAEAARSLRWPLDACANALRLLHEGEFLDVDGDGRYRVTTHWHRAVQRFLQRKKLLVV